VTSTADTEPIIALVAEHLARYAAMSAQDVYKLLHHATMGAEHAVRDVDAVRRWMTREVASLERFDASRDAEPLVERLGVGGTFARVHLRPYLARGGDTDLLLDAFVRSAAIRGEVHALHQAGKAVVASATVGRLPIDPREIGALFAAQGAAGYPAVHHSPAYSARHRPAYRVVAVTELDALHAPLRGA
jgi:hypothetical protein